MENENKITNTFVKFTIPLQMEWEPKEDITAHELALCMPYLCRLGGVMPYEIDEKESYLRHFKITDHNK